jgi:hypothetical protein
VVTTYVKDLAGNRFDQDSSLTGLQRRAWVFTTSADSVTPLEGMQVAAQSDLRNATTAASAYAADNNGSYTGMTLFALEVYGFVQGPGVTTTVTATSGGDQVIIVSEHASGGRAYQYDSASGEIVPIPR